MALLAAAEGGSSERVVHGQERTVPLAVVASRASTLARTFVAVPALPSVNRRALAVGAPVLVLPVAHVIQGYDWAGASTGGWSPAVSVRRVDDFHVFTP